MSQRSAVAGRIVRSRSRRTAESAAADGGISQGSAAAGGIVRSRRTAETAKDPRRLAELCVRGSRRNQRKIRGGLRKSFVRPRCPRHRNSAFTADGGISHLYPRQIRGGWRNLVFAADGGISHRFAAAGGNHFCARDAPPVFAFCSLGS